jgi:sugar O-acyltransferase (sialic acid O-acetyltransferase NeuD family)
MKRLFILGVNGNARDVLDAARILCKRDPDFPKPAGFLDDKAEPNQQVDGLPVLGPISLAREIADALFVNAIGSPESYRAKPKILAKSGVPDTSFLSVVHPSAAVSPSATLDAGSVVLAHSAVGSGARVGRHVMVLQNCVISHDAVVEDFSVLATGVLLSGGVSIGRNAYLGSGCTVRGGIRVGEGALVGMGSAVLKEIPPGEVWIGNPARRLR